MVVKQRKNKTSIRMTDIPRISIRYKIPPGNFYITN